MARGNRKSTIFHDDEDRQRFLEVIEHAVGSYDLRVMAFCLMGNHYHVVLETPRSNLSDAMQFVNGVFAQRSNRRHRQTGHVFEGRFRFLVIERDSYFTRAVRYVVRNPVRAGLVDDPSAWLWSSFRATAGLCPVPRWLNVDWTRWAFDTYSFAEARRRYVDYVNGPPEPKNQIDLNDIILGTRGVQDCPAREQRRSPRAPNRAADAAPYTRAVVRRTAGFLGLARSTHLQGAHGARLSIRGHREISRDRSEHCQQGGCTLSTVDG